MWMNLEPLDAPGIGVEHLEFELARTGDEFAAPRDTARDRGDQTTDRIDVLRLRQRGKIEAGRIQ